jgi:hypothetical protein
MAAKVYELHGKPCTGKQFRSSCGGKATFKKLGSEYFSHLSPHTGRTPMGMKKEERREPVKQGDLAFTRDELNQVKKELIQRREEYLSHSFSR